MFVSSRTSSTNRTSVILSLLLWFCCLSASRVDARQQQQENSNNNTSCSSRLCDEIDRYETVVYASLSLTLITVVLASALQTKFKDNPWRAVEFLVGMGVVKIILGLLLLTSLHPSCPTDCVCPNYNSNHIYPIVVLAVGLSWLARAYRFYMLYQKRQASDELSAMALDAEGPSIQIVDHRPQKVPASGSGDLV